MRRHGRTIALVASAAGALALGCVGRTQDAGGAHLDHPPTVSALSLTSATAWIGGTIGLSVTASDADSDPLSYEWSIAPGDCGFFSVVDAPETSLTVVTPETCTATVTVTAAGASTSGSVVVTVLPAPPADHPPVISAILPPTATVFAGETIGLSVSASDADSDPLSYGWSVAPEGCGTFSAPDTAQTSLAVVTPGTCTVTVTVTAGGASASGSVVVTVLAVDHPPVITAISPPTATVHVGETVSLSVTASDPDSDPLYYAWSAAPPGCGTFSSTNTSATIFTAAAKGTCTATVLVTAAGASTSGSAVVAVDDRPPVITAVSPPSATVHVGETVSLSVTASDPDSDPISYAWSAAPQGCGTFSSTNTYATIFTAAAKGTCTATVLVTAAGASTSGSAVVSVVDRPPVITAISPPSATVHVGETVSLSVAASDPDSDPISYAWSVAPQGCGTFSSAATSATVLTTAALGACTATVMVSAGGASVNRSVTLTVVDTLPPGPAPMPRVGHTYTVMSSSGATSQAVSVSGVGQAVVRWSRGGDTGPNAGNAQDGYDARLSDTTLGGTIDNQAANVPIDYVIEASGGGAFTPLVTVTANTYITRAHQVDLTGYTSVRMRLTSAPRHGGNGVYGTDFDVHDASQGTDDWWIALGDSLTTNVWNVADSIKFGSRIHALDSTRFPIAHEGGVSAAYMADFLWTGWQGTDGRPIFAKWMDDFPGRYVILAIGQNDANAGTNIDTMETRFRQLLDLIVAAGKVPVIPTLRWTYTNGNTSVQNIEAWNARLVTIRASYPTTILPYPDVYTRSKQQGTAGLLGDMTHLNASGVALTQEDWDLWAMGTLYAAP